MNDSITAIVTRLMLAPNGGAIIAAVFDLCRELELPEPNRGHLAGVVRRYGGTENGRRRIWIALAECLGEHIAQRDHGGLGGVTQYMERVIAKSGVAPAARTGAKRSPVADDAVAGLVALGWNVTTAERMTFAMLERLGDKAGEVSGVELLQLVLVAKDKE